MFDNLSIKLEKAFQTLKGQGRITEINVATTVKGNPQSTDRCRRKL